MEKGVDIHFNNRAIQLATSRNIEIMKFLVSLQCDINSQNKTNERVIDLALKENNMEVIEYLFSLNNLECDGLSFLYAVTKSNLKVIQYLVSLNRFGIHCVKAPTDEIRGGNNAISFALYNRLEVLQCLEN